MKILTNQTSKTYPIDEILSYRVKIVKKDSIKVNYTHYTYDVYVFSSIQEYNQWILDEQIKLLESKDKKIKELEQHINELKTSQSISENTINSILTEVIPSIIG